MTEALAVLGKDLAVEFRTRYALSAITQFAFTCLVAVSYAAGPQPGARLQASLLWLVLLFASLSGLARSFVAEEDGRTADSLRLAASPEAVYVGKLAFNLLLLLALTAILVPGYVLFMQVTWRDGGLLVAAVAGGAWGLAAVLTFTSALVARARARGALGAVVAFPLLLPVLILAIGATSSAIDGTQQGWGQISGLVAVAGIMTTVSLLLFETVWQG